MAEWEGGRWHGGLSLATATTYGQTKLHQKGEVVWNVFIKAWVNKKELLKPEGM